MVARSKHINKLKLITKGEKSRRNIKNDNI